MHWGIWIVLSSCLQIRCTSKAIFCCSASPITPAVPERILHFLRTVRRRLLNNCRCEVSNHRLLMDSGRSCQSLPTTRRTAARKTGESRFGCVCRLSCHPDKGVLSGLEDRLDALLQYHGAVR